MKRLPFLMTSICLLPLIVVIGELILGIMSSNIDMVLKMSSFYLYLDVLLKDSGISRLIYGLVFFSLGVWIPFSFHPIFDVKYTNWLCSTPWNHSMPLPKGSVYLGWQEGVVLASLQLTLILFTELHPLFGIGVFGVSYLGLNAILFKGMGLWKFAYGIGLILLLPWLNLDFLNAATFLVSLLLGMIICYFGVKESLSTCQLKEKNWNFNREITEKSELAWPYDQISFCGLKKISWMESISLGLLISFSCVALTNLCIEAAHMEMKGVAVFVDNTRWYFFSYYIVGLAVISRLGIYMAGTRKPLSLMGRIYLKKFVLPRYDIVFITPLVMILGAFILSWGFQAMEAEVPFAVGGIVFCVVLLAFKGGPSLKEWRLKGDYQRVPSKMKVNQFLKL